MCVLVRVLDSCQVRCVWLQYMSAQLRMQQGNEEAICLHDVHDLVGTYFILSNAVLVDAILGYARLCSSILICSILFCSAMLYSILVYSVLCLYVLFYYFDLFHSAECTRHLDGMSQDSLGRRRRNHYDNIGVCWRTLTVHYGTLWCCPISHCVMTCFWKQEQEPCTQPAKVVWELSYHIHPHGSFRLQWTMQS